MNAIISFFITVILMFEAIPLVWVPSLNVDASKELAPVSTRATGFLYGLAEEGVPSSVMTDSLDISSVSQKVTDGLQHPTGDISHVYPQLDECDYTVVYLQDAYSTWYYCHDEIMEMRKNGTYDWKRFITESYFPIIKEKTHLPIIIDPSHATGNWKYIEKMSLAAVAAGADGLIIEVHEKPECAWSDGAQCLKPDKFAQLIEKARKIAQVVGRDL